MIPAARRRAGRVTLALLLLGIALKVALSFPVHRYPADADCALSGLCAFRVLRGELPVFFSHVRIGSLNCYLTALLFMLTGPSRAALAAGPVIVAALLLVVWHRFVRELLGRRAATVALPFMVLPAPVFAFWTYMPNGYPMTILCCGLILWLAARTVRKPDQRWAWLGFGGAIGLGWWTSLLTVGCSLPALIWVLGSRRRLLKNPSFAFCVLGAALLGALPWILFNVRYQFPSLTMSFTTRPVEGWTALIENLGYVLFAKLPELLVCADPTGGRVAVGGWQRALRLPVAAGLVVAALSCLAVIVQKTGATASREELRRRRCGWLLVFVTTTVVALNVVSEAGSVRDHAAVRYVLPLYLLVPPVLASFLLVLWRRSRPLATAVAAVILSFNLAGSYLPGTEPRRQWRQDMLAEQQLLAVLTQAGTQVVVGPYWTVYGLNFVSRERVQALPVDRNADHYRVAQRLKPAARWALLAPGWDWQTMRRWLAASRLEGQAREVGPYIVVLFPTPRPAAEDPGWFLERLRQAYGTRLPFRLLTRPAP